MKTEKKKSSGDPKYRERVYQLVRRIPRGRVTTYGEIAYILGEGYTPRTVGFVMHGAGTKTPWHRVINSRGSCSTGGVVLPSNKQQLMLETEGVEFNDKGCCNLETYLWHPRQKSRIKKETAKARAALRRG